MTYAVVDICGCQVVVETGKFYDLNYIPAEPGDVINLNRVLFLSKNNVYSLGKPCLDDVIVKATVLKHLGGNKIAVFKMKSKKNSRVKKGHRQRLTRIFIDDIFNFR